MRLGRTAHSREAPRRSSVNILSSDITRSARPLDLARSGKGRARSALDMAARSWFVVAVIGQLMMAAYVAVFYGGAALRGDLAGWNKVLPHGYVAGDTVGNLIVASHLLFTVFIIVGGALQLIPGVRQHWPVLHRWNGRIYLASALVMSIGGLLMVWTRDSAGDPAKHIGISLNALLIIGCAGMALRHAVARRFAEHRHWALRLFLVVGGVWFFRIGLMFWILINGGPVGFDPKTFQGPFLTFLSFAQTLVPLGVLELYLRAQDAGRPRAQLAMAASLIMLTLMTATGIFAASMMLWLPHL